MSELEKQLAVRDQPRPEMLPKFEFLRAEEPSRGQYSTVQYSKVQYSTVYSTVQ